VVRRGVGELSGGGTFDVYVVQFALAGGRTEQDVKLRTFAVGTTNAGQRVGDAGQPAGHGRPAGDVHARLDRAHRGYPLPGVVEYSDGTAVHGSTLVRYKPRS
jgi:hypothetical protein